MTVFEYVALSVGSIAEQRRFYAAAFGLDHVESERDLTDQLRTVILRDAGGRLKIELIESADSIPRVVTDPVAAARYQTWNHLALRVGDLESAVAAASAAGGRVVIPPSAAARPGTRIAFVADPEDNLIELVEVRLDPAA
jgi:catechol 2,3-dioxygenase-like lactoylglutathione lyase family enzyme